MPRPSALTTIMTPGGVEHGVDDALDARIGEVERVEGARQEAEGAERQRGEDEEDPGGGERPAQPARRAGFGIAMEDAAGEPAERSGDERKRQGRRRHAHLHRRGQPFADGAEPVADEALHHLGVDRRFPPDGNPQLRIEDARRPGECALREQLAPRGAYAGREIVGLQQHGAGGAQVRVERVVPLLLALELLGRDIGRGRGLARFWGELREPFG